MPVSVKIEFLVFAVLTPCCLAFQVFYSLRRDHGRSGAWMETGLLLWLAGQPFPVTDLLRHRQYGGVVIQGAYIVFVVWWLWRRWRKGPRRAPRAAGAKSLALRAKLVKRMREVQVPA